MPRNLDRRVEVLAPIACERARVRIRHECIDSLEHDNCRVFEMRADGVYTRRRPREGENPSDAQLLALGAPQRSGSAAKRQIVVTRRRSAPPPPNEAKTSGNGAQSKTARTRQPTSGGAQST
jgi:hypothetical protein